MTSRQASRRRLKSGCAASENILTGECEPFQPGVVSTRPRSLDHAGQDQRSDDDEDERGEHVAPLLKPLSLYLIPAEAPQKRETPNGTITEANP